MLRTAFERLRPGERVRGHGKRANAQAVVCCCRAECHLPVGQPRCRWDVLQHGVTSWFVVSCCVLCHRWRLALCRWEVRWCARWTTKGVPTSLPTTPWPTCSTSPYERWGGYSLNKNVPDYVVGVR